MSKHAVMPVLIALAAAACVHDNLRDAADAETRLDEHLHRAARLHGELPVATGR